MVVKTKRRAGSDMSDRSLVISDGNTPSAFRFDLEIVSSHSDSEESVFAPVGSPRVSSDPVLFGAFDAPSDDGDFVVNVDERPFREDTTGVGFELFGDSDTAGNRSSLVDFSFHLSDAADSSVLGDLPDWVVLHRPARAGVDLHVDRDGRGAVHAFLNVRA